MRKESEEREERLTEESVVVNPERVSRRASIDPFRVVGHDEIGETVVAVFGDSFEQRGQSVELRERKGGKEKGISGVGTEEEER